MYPEDLDICRIDMCIGEKAYWNRGIGTQFIGVVDLVKRIVPHKDYEYLWCKRCNVLLL
jgi:hypothetical protein